ncbi:MAG: squalene/phytoene synthase family protein [Myxococcales bacterium]|nr:squalene/phytoene synthase family protein [Myxococcales bacterium]
MSSARSAEARNKNIKKTTYYPSIGPVHNLEQPSNTAEDREFIHRTVPTVSRTFALSINALPSRLSTTVGTAYLLCRIADSIEDEVGIQSERRHQLFTDFRQLMLGEGDLHQFCSAPEWKDIPPAHAALCQGAHHVFAVFRALSPPEQEAILSPVLELAEGMSEYVRRASLEGQLHIRSMEDLDRYCYYVAGTVGKLLTNLFLAHAAPLKPQTATLLHERAVPFGLGLQLINILRDIDADLQRGVCFIPSDLLQPLGLRPHHLLDANYHAEFRELTNTIANHARKQLKQAIEYTMAWPSSEADVRFFLVVPLTLALRTLSIMTSSHEPLTTSKICREEVLELFQKIQQFVEQDDQLEAFLYNLLTGS